MLGNAKIRMVGSADLQSDGSILSFTWEMKLYAASKPYISSIVDEISLWDIPLAYIANTFSSMAETSFFLLGIRTGSNEASLSLGDSISISPWDVFNVFLV